MHKGTISSLRGCGCACEVNREQAPLTRETLGTAGWSRDMGSTDLLGNGITRDQMKLI